MSETSLPELTMPEPLAVTDLPMPDGAVLRVRRHGNPYGPRVVLSHGNGFAIDGYFAFWRLLLDRFDVVVYDQRNHGQNPFFGSRGHNHPGFARDQRFLRQALEREWGSKQSYGLFHSVSAIAALIDIQEGGFGWDGLVLYDPPMVPPANVDAAMNDEAMAFESFMGNWAFSRPDHFDSPEQLAEQFASVRSLAGWYPGTHRLLARAILRPDERRGGWTLACPKMMEGATYVMNAYLRVYDALDRVVPYSDRILFLMADPDMKGSKPPGRVARLFQKQFGFNVEWLENASHLLQLEQPEECLKRTIAFLEKIGLPRADAA